MKDTQVSRILSVYKRNANILITGALIIFLGFLGGCISDIPQEVIVYTSHDQIHSAPILNLFQAKTGIKVKAVYDVEAAKTAGIVNRLIAEKTHPRCDVFWNNENSRTVVLKHKGVLAPYRSTAAASIPDQFKDPDGFWTGFGARARVIIYNTDLIRPDQAPHSIYDFIQPQWRGQFAIANPLFGTTASHAAALFVFLGDTQARHYFLALQANDVVIAAGNSVVKDMVASGEVKAGLTDTDDVNMALLAGKPVGMIYPDQNAMGTLVIPNTVALIHNGPHPENGRKLIDYLLSSEVESKLAFSASAQMPVRSDIAKPDNIPSVNSIKAMYLQIIFVILLTSPAALASTNIGGTIATNTTWSVAGSPYIVTSNITVTSGADLTIEAGVQVKFYSGFSLSVEGSLTAIGTASNTIIFTSNQGTPAAGDWYGIRFKPQSSGAMQHCIVEYTHTGLSFYPGTAPQILNSSIRNNFHGVSAIYYETTENFGYPAPVINYCRIYQNSDNYFYMLESNKWWADSVLNAKYNWWGTTNPLEIAESIMDYRKFSHQAAVNFVPFSDSNMRIVAALPALPELKHSISILQAMTGINPSEMPNLDIDSDGKTGLPESVFTLEYIAQLRQALTPTKEQFINGIVLADMTLTVTDSPYVITKNVRILPDVTLTIEPGVRLEFQNRSFGIDGHLEANGTATTNITFTHTSDTDTWGGIHFFRELQAVSPIRILSIRA